VKLLTFALLDSTELKQEHCRNAGCYVQWCRSENFLHI